RAEIFFENTRCFRVASAACAWKQKILLAEIHEPLQMVARRKGFEPLTPRFEVWCSIQLSYRRHINATFARLRHFPSSSREQWPSTSRCQTNNPLHSNPTRQLPPLRPRTGWEILFHCCA